MKSPSSSCTAGESAGGDRRLLLSQLRFDQLQPIVAEEHVVAVEEHRWRTEATAIDQLFGIDAQTIFIGIGSDLVEEFVYRKSTCRDNSGQHRVLRNVREVAPVSMEYTACICF